MLQLTVRVVVPTFPCSLSDPTFGKGIIPPPFTFPMSGDFYWFGLCSGSAGPPQHSTPPGYLQG